MSNEAQMAEKELAPAKVQIPVILNTPTGVVAVWGAEHVSKTLLNVLDVMLAHDPFETVHHGVKSVVFRIDGFPKKGSKQICASFSPDVCGISVNLEKTIERAIERSMDNPETSLLSSWWIEMMLNLGHELHHGVRWDTDKDKLDNDELLEEEEERAEAYANDLITQLTMHYNIELPNIKEEVWFNNQIIELLSGKGNDDWAKSQKEMINEKIVWRYEPKDSETITLHTFRDLICLISGGDMESEEWTKDTIDITNTVIDTKTPAAATVEEHTTETVGDYDFVEDDCNCDDLYPDTGQTTIPTYTPAAAAQPYKVPAAEGDLLSAEDVHRLTKSVYMKMYNHIFTHCKPLQNSDVGFSNPDAVLSIPLILTEEERRIFVSMNHHDVNMRWCPDVSTENGLLGKVMKNTKLPSYEVTLDVNGTLHRRLLIPQNPNKKNNGTLTRRALEARAGHGIAYTKNMDTDGWGPWIENGVYHVPKVKT